MALSSTIHVFEIDLADSDRAVYESLELRVARHPSESAEYLVARVLAYCLEYTDGIAFSKGLSEPDQPAIAVRDLAGALRRWIEVGTPDAARLHKASKTSPQVAVYVHKEPTQFLKSLAGARIHNAARLELYAIDRPLIAALVVRLDRRMTFALSITDRDLYLSTAAETLVGTVRTLS